MTLTPADAANTFRTAAGGGANVPPKRSPLLCPATKGRRL